VTEGDLACASRSLRILFELLLGTTACSLLISLASGVRKTGKTGIIDDIFQHIVHFLLPIMASLVIPLEFSDDNSSHPPLTRLVSIAALHQLLRRYSPSPHLPLRLLSHMSDRPSRN
jgi:xanthine/uracil/vitamin C permease (AzgA family)